MSAPESHNPSNRDNGTKLRPLTDPKVSEELIKGLGLEELQNFTLVQLLRGMNRKLDHDSPLPLKTSPEEEDPGPKLILHSKARVIEAIREHTWRKEDLVKQVKTRTQLQNWTSKEPELLNPELDPVWQGEPEAEGPQTQSQAEFLAALNHLAGKCLPVSVLSLETLNEVIGAFYSHSNPLRSKRVRRVFTSDRNLELGTTEGVRISELRPSTEAFGSMREFIESLIPVDYRHLCETGNPIKIGDLVGLCARWELNLDAKEQEALGNYLRKAPTQREDLKLAIAKILKSSNVILGRNRKIGKSSGVVLIGSSTDLDPASSALLESERENANFPLCLLKGKNGSKAEIKAAIAKRVIKKEFADGANVESDTDVEKDPEDLREFTENLFKKWEELLQKALEACLLKDVLEEKTIEDPLTYKVPQAKIYRAVPRSGIGEIYALYAAALRNGPEVEVALRKRDEALNHPNRPLELLATRYEELARHRRTLTHLYETTLRRLDGLLAASGLHDRVESTAEVGVPESTVEKIALHLETWEQTGAPPLSYGWTEVADPDPDEIDPKKGEKIGEAKNGEWTLYLYQGEFYKIVTRPTSLSLEQRKFLAQVKAVFGEVVEDPSHLTSEALARVESWNLTSNPVCTVEDLGMSGATSSDWAGRSEEVKKTLRLKAGKGTKPVVIVDTLEMDEASREIVLALAKELSGEVLFIFTLDTSSLKQKELTETCKAKFKAAMTQFTQKAALDNAEAEYQAAFKQMQSAFKFLTSVLPYEEAIPLLVEQVDAFFDGIGVSRAGWLEDCSAEDAFIEEGDAIGEVIELVLDALLQKGKEAAEDHNPTSAKDAYPYIREIWSLMRQKVNPESGMSYGDKFTEKLCQRAEEMATLQLDMIRLGVLGEGAIRVDKIPPLKKEYHHLTKGDAFLSGRGHIDRPLLQLYFDFTEAYIRQDNDGCKRLFKKAFNGSTIPYEDQFFHIAMPDKFGIVGERKRFPRFAPLSTKAEDVAAKMAIMAMESARRTRDRASFEEAMAVFRPIGSAQADYIRAIYFREIGHWEVDVGGIATCDVQVAKAAYMNASKILSKRDAHDPKRLDSLNFDAEILRIESLQNVKLARSETTQDAVVTKLNRALSASLEGIDLLTQASEAIPDQWVYKISRFQALFRCFTIGKELIELGLEDNLLRIMGRSSWIKARNLFSDNGEAVLVEEATATQRTLNEQGNGLAKHYGQYILDNDLNYEAGTHPTTKRVQSEWEAFLGTLS